MNLLGEVLANGQSSKAKEVASGERGRGGAPTAGRGESDRWLDFGFWAVAFIDLLGQQKAFLRTDRLPEPEQADAFRNEVVASLGVVRQLRKTLKQFRRAFTSSEIRIRCTRPRSRRSRVTWRDYARARLTRPQPAARSAGPSARRLRARARRRRGARASWPSTSGRARGIARGANAA